MPMLGWIGLGNFGNPIAQACLDAGYKVHGFSVNGRGEKGVQTLLASHPLAAEGKNMKEMHALALCLPRSSDVDQVLNHFVDTLPPLIFDLTTGDPFETERRVAKWLAKGVRIVDCPVSGSKEAARNGKLTVFAGIHEGNKEIDTFLHTIGTYVFYFEKAGQGHAAKLINQLIHLSIMGVIGDGLHLAEQVGLDLEQVVAACKTSSANSAMLTRFGDSLVAKDYTPHFTLELARKDIRLVQSLARQLHCSLSYPDVTEQLMNNAMEKGLGKYNFSIMCKK
jgi:3-hydroxyisobutyrate dehydrogenase-like beta-hydroxyacid dehydrogenase